MTAPYEFQVLTSSQVASIRELQEIIGAGNREKGFHDEGREVRGLPALMSGVHVDSQNPIRSWLSRFSEKIRRLIPALERHYWMARLSLITTEVAEAIEEIRKGRAVNETYYPTWDETFDGRSKLPFSAKFKPEGVPSEVADTVIRSLDFADEAKFDLAEIIDGKLAYNATRPFKHGKKL